MAGISEELSRPAYEDLGEPEPIEPIFADGIDASLQSWEGIRETLRGRWDEVLGSRSFGSFDRTPEVVETFESPGYRATVLRQPTDPDTRQILLVMDPLDSPSTPRPGMAIPFYHPDPMAGIDLTSREPITEAPNIQFGRHLVQQGYTVVCSEAYPYNTVPEPEDSKGFAWWQAAAEKLLHENPDWTGIARLVWDASRAVDCLLEQPDVDARRIGIMGHSLGGKIAYYTGALDERIQATVSSDFGMGFSFTNWDAPWYLGDQIHRDDFTLGHHHLLALMAPRPFFLFGGEADRPATWQYIQEAQKVYALHGKQDAVGFFDHASGHRPTEESLTLAYRWLSEQFGLPERPWEL